jgi:CheY-like chemotaxis protein
MNPAHYCRGFFAIGRNCPPSNAEGFYMQRRATNRILVVEDNDDLRESISEVLALHGYVATVAENGKVALDQLELSPTPPALILLDLLMPVMDGITFLQSLRAIPRFSHVPVLLMTAQPSPPPLEVAAVLTKPVAFNSLLSLVKRFGGRGVAGQGPNT